MNDSSVFDGIKNAFERVFDRQDKAGRELLDLVASVHQSRRIGHKDHVGHDIEEFLGGLLHGVAVRAVSGIPLRDIVGYAPKKSVRGLDDAAFFIFAQIAFFEYFGRVDRDLDPAGDFATENGALGSTKFSVLLAVQNVRLGHFGLAGIDQNDLHNVLDLLNSRDRFAELISQNRDHAFTQ